MSSWRTRYDERTGRSHPDTDLLKCRAEELQERYEAGMRALLRGDGTRRYSDAERR